MLTPKNNPNSAGDEPKVALKVLGISYSPNQQSAYTLLLAQEDGPIRIPVVIGAAEAQSIRIKLENITTPRPMTHDLFASFMAAYGVKLKQAFIYKFEEGIFSSELTFTDGERELTLDSRTSDAVALAVRAGAPIYTTDAILHQAGTVFDDEGRPVPRDPSAGAPSGPAAPASRPRGNDPETMPIEELRRMLARLIDDENYEEAARISEIIKRREAQ